MVDGPKSSLSGHDGIADIPWLLHRMAMTAYDDVDAVIDAWAQSNVKKLFTEVAGEGARFAYLPGLQPLECFQISIDPPRAGRVTVSARSVDTDDGSEFERLWEGQSGDLAVMLEEATDAVRVWVNRSPAKGS